MLHRVAVGGTGRQRVAVCVVFDLLRGTICILRCVAVLQYVATGGSVCRVWVFAGNPCMDMQLYDLWCWVGLE